MSDNQAPGPDRQDGPIWVRLFIQAVLAGGVLWSGHELHSLHNLAHAPPRPPSCPSEPLEVRMGPPPPSPSLSLTPITEKLGEIKAAIDRLTPKSPLPPPPPPCAETQLQLKQTQMSLQQTQTLLDKMRKENCTLLDRNPRVSPDGKFIPLPAYCLK